jgi:hypothetical protein
MSMSFHHSFIEHGKAVVIPLSNDNLLPPVAIFIKRTTWPIVGSVIHHSYAKWAYEQNRYPTSTSTPTPTDLARLLLIGVGPY